MRLWLIILAVAGLPSTASAQAYVSGRVLEGDIIPSLPVLVYVSRDGTTLAESLTDSAGLFRLGPLKPGRHVIVFERLCLRRSEVEIVVDSASAAVDVGDVRTEPLRPRPQRTHMLCPPMPDEDARTRELLALVAADSTWIEFGSRHTRSEMPATSQWLFWGSSVELFGVDRNVLSSVAVGTGLSAVAIARGADYPYKGPLISVSSGDDSGLAVISVAVRDEPTTEPLPYIRCTFRREGSGWAIEAVTVMTN